LCDVSPWLGELPQKAKGICHLVIQRATSVGEINQSKPKNENTHQLEKSAPS
jgi:hypothetical protein